MLITSLLNFGMSLQRIIKPSTSAVRAGVQGCKHTHKTFGLSKIRANSLKNLGTKEVATHLFLNE